MSEQQVSSSSERLRWYSYIIAATSAVFLVLVAVLIVDRLRTYECESVAVVKVPLAIGGGDTASTIDFLISEWVLAGAVSENGHGPLLGRLNIADPVAQLRRRLHVASVQGQPGVSEIRCLGRSPLDASTTLSEVLDSLLNLRREHIQIQQDVIDWSREADKSFVKRLAMIEAKREATTVEAEARLLEEEADRLRELQKIASRSGADAQLSRQHFADIEVVRQPALPQ